MGKRWLATAMAMAATMVCASSASAAVEVGNDCVATTGTSNSTLVQLTRATPSALPLTVPSAGVVTAWTVRSNIVALLTEKLKVLRATGAPNQFTTVGESAVETVAQGTNTFKTRIPVLAGDRFGAYGGAPSPTGVAQFCAGGAGDEIGLTPGDTPLGTSAEFPPAAGILVAVSATVEPDADGDGYGDETQDKCPRSAKLQTECPLLGLGSFGIASKNSALILVASSLSTPVTVDATVTVPGKKKKGKKGKAKTLKLTGGTQTVAPGQLARFVVAYSVPLKSALTALPRKRSLSLKVTVSGADATGLAATSATTLRLKGQAKRKK